MTATPAVTDSSSSATSESTTEVTTESTSESTSEGTSEGTSETTIEGSTDFSTTESSVSSTTKKPKNCQKGVHTSSDSSDEDVDGFECMAADFLEWFISITIEIELVSWSFQQADLIELFQRFEVIMEEEAAGQCPVCYEEQDEAETSCTVDFNLYQAMYQKKYFIFLIEEEKDIAVNMGAELMRVSEISMNFLFLTFIGISVSS